MTLRPKTSTLKHFILNALDKYASFMEVLVTNFLSELNNDFFKVFIQSEAMKP